MTIEQIQDKLVELHKNGQLDGGFDDSDTVDLDCKPLDDLEGFDSMLIPRFIRQLARELDAPIEKGVRIKNLYQIGREKQTIKQIANRFMQEYCKAKTEVVSK